MPKGLVTQTKNQGGSPWMAEPLNTSTHILRYGAKLDATAFVAQADGRVYVPSGTYVGRMRVDELWEPATALHEERALTSDDVFDATDENDVALVRPGWRFMFYRDALPGYGTMAADVKGLLEQEYLGIEGSTE